MWLILPSCTLSFRYSLGRGRKEGNHRLCCCVAGKWRNCNQIWSVETWDGNSSGKLGRYIALFHATWMAKCVAEFSSTSPASHLALEQCNRPWGSKHTHIPHLSVPPSHQLTPLLKQLEDVVAQRPPEIIQTKRESLEESWHRMPHHYFSLGNSTSPFWWNATFESRLNTLHLSWSINNQHKS